MGNQTLYSSLTTTSTKGCCGQNVLRCDFKITNGFFGTYGKEKKGKLKKKILFLCLVLVEKGRKITTLKRKHSKFFFKLTFLIIFLSFGFFFTSSKQSIKILCHGLELLIKIQVSDGPISYLCGRRRMIRYVIFT